MKKRIQNYFQTTEQGTVGIIRATISSFFAHFAFMLPAFLIMYFIDAALSGQLPSQKQYLLAVLAVGLIMYIVVLINYNTLYNETYKESKNIRLEMAEIMRRLPLSYFAQHDVSDLAATMTTDVTTMEHALSHAIPQSISIFFFIIVISILLLIGNWRLGLCITIPIYLATFLLYLSKKFQLRETKRDYLQKRELTEAFQESIELQQEIRSYGHAEHYQEKLMQGIEQHEKLHMRAELYQVVPLIMSTNVERLTLGLTIFFGSLIYLQGHASLPFLIGYILAAAKIVDAINGLFSYLAEVFYIDARIERIGALRQTPIQAGEEAELKSFDIVLENVSFGYNEDRNVVKNASFTARQGEVTAIVGPSGCGKTTLLRLVSRLYDYDQGSIKIDGKEIKEIATESLYAHIATVFQDVTLFNSSVIDNIRIGKPEASEEEIKEAARLAGCEDFIQRLPKGYDSLIGENGSLLSGGERQRLSIARAILKDAPIILLDEISASLDVENEKQIQESLNYLIQDKTVVIVSHRMKSIQNVDQIVLMDEGQVVAKGRHAELMESSGLYRNLVEKSELTEDFQY
ncbi:MAG: ABC transporter ATP-binding protein [Eubacteriales bacterium]|nr:ABC transporter ATP-binding protein [Eubacteriales bacterium]